MARPDFHERYEHRILMSVFDSVSAYNRREPRHPLPDFASNTPWEARYTGFEPSTALPATLDEALARDLVLGLARLRDATETERRNPDSPYGRMMASSHPGKLMLFNTIGYLCVLESNLCTYLAKTLFDIGLEPQTLTHVLGNMGVKCEGIPDARRSKTGFISYKPMPYANAQRLAEKIAALPKASYLGYLMAHCHGSKPQYTQPMLFFIGDALDRAHMQMPEFDDAITRLKTIYADSGLKDAVRSLHALVRHSPPPPNRPASLQYA
jgi:hypothetical protein